MPDPVGEQLAHQQRGVIPVRVPRAEHPGRERPGSPGPLRPPGHGHALPHRPGHQRTCLPRPAPRPEKPPRAADGHTGMHTRLSAARQAGKHAVSAARPWPSVKQPTVCTDRDGGRIPSAMRPWTPRHSGLQRHKVTHAGTEETARTAENSRLAGRFRRWWQVLGSNQRRLSRRFYRPLSSRPSHMPLTSTYTLRGVISGCCRPSCVRAPEDPGKPAWATDGITRGHGRPGRERLR